MMGMVIITHTHAHMHTHRTLTGAHGFGTIPSSGMLSTQVLQVQFFNQLAQHKVSSSCVLSQIKLCTQRRELKLKHENFILQ